MSESTAKPSDREWIRTLEGRLAECYRLTGSDPDGDSDAHLAGKAVQAVQELRAEGEANALEELGLREAAEETLKGLEEAATRFADSVERDRRESDKVLCHLATIRRVLTDLRLDPTQQQSTTGKGDCE